MTSRKLAGYVMIGIPVSIVLIALIRLVSPDLVDVGVLVGIAVGMALIVGGIHLVVD